MTQIETYKIRGVAVSHYIPEKNEGKAPIVMVHGGQHGAWGWEKWATFFSEAGYEVHALNWFNHGDSDKLPESEFAHRSITAVAREEITYVAEQIGRPFILIGHSMGGLASAVYTVSNATNVTRLALITPVMPAAATPEIIPLPVDPEHPFPVLPAPQAKQFFFTKTDEATAADYIKLLVPESAQAVTEATRWTVEFDPAAITTPTLVMGTEFDQLIPKAGLRRYAQLLNARFEEIPGIGHSDILLKAPEWQVAASHVKEWLES